MSPPDLAALLLAGAFSIAMWTRLAELRRGASLRRAAAAMGWRYEPFGDAFVKKNLGALPLMRHGRSLAKNLVTDGRLTLFDYAWRSGPGSLTSGAAMQAVGAAQAAGLPAFRLEFKRPATFGVPSAVYAPDDEVDLPGPSAFTDQYRVFGRDPEGLAARFTRPVLAFFAEHPGWCVEADGRWLIAYQESTQLDAEHLGPRADAMRRIAALLDAR